jgi:membrane fusion protein, multidrug efflux system
MQKQIPYILTIAIVLFAVACSSKKDAAANLNDKKVELEKLKSENSKNAADMKKLQEDIAKADTANGKKAKAKLVATTPVSSQNFNHYIDLQGVVNAENISYISPRGMPGQVRAIYVKQGQYITKGQLVLKLDNAIVNQQVQGANQQAVAAKQQLEGLRTQLAFAKNILVRQQNLWNQGIGTEVQLLTAKTNVQALENQLSASGEQVKAVYEQVKVAKEQLNTANVYSDVSGVIEQLNIRVGETFTGVGVMGAQIKVVNTSSLKVLTTISENYIGRIRQGSLAEVTLPDYNLTYNSSVSLISQTIDQNRGFTAEIKLPADSRLKPNQTAKVRILDYAAPNAVVIPINVIQSDEVSKYVYVLQKLSNGKAIAKKVIVNIGEVYGDKVEIKQGLIGGEELITEGYLSIYEGQSITTTIN